MTRNLENPDLHKRKLRMFIMALLIGTGLFFAGKRNVIRIQQFDVHSGAMRVERHGYWGRVTYETMKPWREADFEKLFGEEPKPRWLPVGKRVVRVFPDLSRAGRRRARRDSGNDYGENGNGAFWVGLNLSQVVDAPHISDQIRREIIYESFDPENPNEPVRNTHILDTVRQEVLNATAFPEAERAEWQDKFDRDDAGDIIQFLKEACKYPAKPDS